MLQEGSTPTDKAPNTSVFFINGSKENSNLHQCARLICNAYNSKHLLDDIKASSTQDQTSLSSSSASL